MGVLEVAEIMKKQVHHVFVRRNKMFKLLIDLVEYINNNLASQINKCPKDSKVWALLPLIVYAVPFASALLEIELEQTMFIFIIITVIFYQRVEMSLKVIKYEWKVKHIEIWLIMFLIPRVFLESLNLVKPTRPSLK